MPLLRECNHCGRVEREFDPNSLVCERCQDLKYEFESEAFRVMREVFGAHVAAKVAVISMLKHCHDEHPEQFRNHFGTAGEERLKEALAAVGDAMNQTTEASDGERING